MDNIDIAESANSPKQILKNYFRTLIHRNPSKYQDYIRSLKWGTKILSWTKSRIWNVMPYQYGALRIIDDRIDGDMVLPSFNSDIVAYAKRRFAFIASLGNIGFRPETPEDILLQKVIEYTEKYGYKKEMFESISLITESMIFDAKRISEYKKTGELNFPKEDELKQHFFNLDIRGTGIGMLIYTGSKDIYGELEYLKNIGKLCRIEYNLHDLVEDIENGIINISHKDARNFGITRDDLLTVKNFSCTLPNDPKDPAKIWQHDLQKYPESIKHWIEGQLKEFDTCYDNFIRKDNPRFPFFTRIIFWLFYTREAQRNIQRIKEKLYIS